LDPPHPGGMTDNSQTFVRREHRASLEKGNANADPI